MRKPDNPPAFPTPCVNGSNGEYYTSTVEGMTLRDYFAAKAMQALMLDKEFHLRGDVWCVADRAYEYADMMLKEREK